MARWGVGRMHYSVIPGLYAIGEPDPDSPVLVTANYKMTFDRVRSSLGELAAWVLVLDTDGINVWCAAGHGSFGTDELVHRIELTGLKEIVSHRRLIVPQLGGPGIAAHKIAKATRFKVVWGPVRIDDLSDFLAAGAKATPAMRRKEFPLRDRAALIPMELVPALIPSGLLVLAAVVLPNLAGSGAFLAEVAAHGLLGATAVISALVAGAVATPLLLPWLPGRSFSCKGGSAGIIFVGATLAAVGWGAWIEDAGWLLVGSALAAFLGMNFTGSSTFTSLSGVRREMGRWVPLEIAATVVGIGLIVASRWLA